VDTSGATGTPLTQGAFKVTFGSIQTVSIVTPLKLSVGSVSYTLSTACLGSCVYSGPTSWMNMTLSGTCTGGACLLVAPVSSEATGLLVGSEAGGFSVAGNISSPAPTVTFTGAFAR
jgi:hypothetical protein